MTKEELIDLVKITLGDKHHEKVIEKALNAVWNTILYNTFKSNPDDLDLYAKEYNVLTAALLTDAVTGLVYFVLPAAISQLPRAEQLREVRPLQDTTNTFDIINLSQRATLNNLQSDAITEKRTTCWVRGSRVEFEDLTAAHKSAGIMAVLVVAFDVYADTDVIYVPSGQDAQLLQLVSSYIANMPPETNIDNNTNKQT